jgi:hypothetical protein
MATCNIKVYINCIYIIYVVFAMLDMNTNANMNASYTQTDTNTTSN